MPTAMPCGATPRASSTTFSAAPAFAPAASRTRSGSGGSKAMSGRQLIGTATTTPRALHVLPSPARHVTVSPAHRDRVDRRPGLDVDARRARERAREAAPAVCGRVRKARHETCQPAVACDRAERIGRGAAFRRRSAHELPPAEQEVAHRSVGASDSM